MKSIKTLISVLSIAVILASCRHDGKNVEVLLSDYIGNDTVADIMPAIRKALEECARYDSSTLILPKGHFIVKPEFAYEQYCYVCNNDNSLKRIAFNMSGCKNLSIKGNETHLDFVGYLVPFLISNAEDISISGIYIDYTTPFHAEAKINAVAENYVDLTFDTTEFVYDIRNNHLYFDKTPTGFRDGNLLLEFDSNRRETAMGVCDYWVNGSELCEQLPNGDVRIFHDNISAHESNIFVFGPSHRLIPCFIVEDSRNITLEDVTIYHAGAMGVIAQRSENIELNKVTVTPSPDKNRILSTIADATHFCNCSGYIRMIDCIFENQKDDATNIHGIYAAIAKIESPRTIIVKYVHKDQLGFNFISEGMNLELVNNADLIQNCIRKVESCKVLNKEYTRVTFTEDLPADVKLNYVVANVDAYPDVLIKGCTIRNNRARGILLGSRGKVVVEDNYFHTPGAAILFEGDGSFWYEQSGVRDVEICNNTFDNCNFGCQGWGKACISVGTGIWENQKESRYHKNIKIHDNIFKNFGSSILNMYCVNGLIFYDNTIEQSEDYKKMSEQMFICPDTLCDNVNIRL